MSLKYRWILSGLSLFGIIVFANYINDIETRFLSTLIIVVLYQLFLAVIGASSYFIGKHLNLIKDEPISNNEEQEALIEEFDIHDINFDGSKVIGHFGGKEIYDVAKIAFKNGLQKNYKFSDTIKYENFETIDVSKLKPGSIVLDPGIVYEPMQ